MPVVNKVCYPYTKKGKAAARKAAAVRKAAKARKKKK